MPVTVKALYRVVPNMRIENRQNYPFVVINSDTGKPVAYVGTEKLGNMYRDQLNNKGYLEICAW